MLDSKLLRTNLDMVASKLLRRGFSFDKEYYKQLELKRKSIQQETEDLQAFRNLKSKEIGKAKASGNEAEVKKILEEVSNLGNELNDKKNSLDSIQNEIKKIELSLPNIPSDDVPDGTDESQNEEILRWGQPAIFNFDIKDHVELGEKNDFLNFPLAVKLSGSRFNVMKSQFAKLHRALTQFMLNTHVEEHGYTEYYVPYLVNQDTMFGSGQFPKFMEDVFPIKREDQHDLFLIPTAEVSLVNLVRDELLNDSTLPLKLTTHSPCFRSEAGSYGRDTRGLIRQHQFDKVEMVQVVHPEESEQALEEMTGHAEKILQLLELPYRKMLLCAGDMGASAIKTYDLEVWVPSQNTYREISSCSNCADFQARRMKTRFKSKVSNKTELVHTLNGSGLAVGRTLVAIIENYQMEDGRIKVPNVLRPYLNGVEFIN